MTTRAKNNHITEAKKIMRKNYRIIDLKIYDNKLYRSLTEGKLNKPYDMTDESFEYAKSKILNYFNVLQDYHKRMNHTDTESIVEVAVIDWFKNNVDCELVINETLKPDYNEAVEMLKTKKNRWTRVSVDPITQECIFKYKGIEFKGYNSTTPVIRALLKPVEYSNVPERIMWNYLEGIL